MKVLLPLIIILGIAILGWIFLGSGFKKSIEVSPEVLESLSKDKPAIAENEDQFLNQLEQNAVSGGPPKDGIPAIDKPQYTDVSGADKWLLENDVVFGVDYHGFVAAYPQRILVWHEVLNETINNEMVSVTYCPLTGTAIGFKGKLAQDLLSNFGVSGKLVNSNLIMYDRTSDSYWSQIYGKSIKGRAFGRSLEEFPIVWTTWEKWKKKYPNTKVLSQETGFARNYGENGDPYGSYLRGDGGYYTSDRIIFEPLDRDNRLKPKTVVVGIRNKERDSVAILKDTLRGKKAMETDLGGRTVVLTYDQEIDFYEAKFQDTGETINAFDAMWFAWVAFYPNTKLIQ